MSSKSKYFFKTLLQIGKPPYFNYRAISSCIDLLARAFKGQFVIPEFSHFCKQIDEIYQTCKLNEDGKVSSLIQNH